jgi:hypothetical protein
MNNPLYLRIMCDVQLRDCSYESGEWTYRSSNCAAPYETLVICINEDNVLYYEMYNIPEDDEFPNMDGELHSNTQLKEMLEQMR